MTIAHPKFAYQKGLHQIGNGAYAWLQPDGGWGWSNSGLIVDNDQALVVDTLFDVPLTQDMLAAYADAESAAKKINKVINTHHNGDHCNGNCCCPDAQIIAHRATAEHMLLEPPELVQGFLDAAADLGDMGKYLTSCFGPFDFKSVDQKIPDTLFDGDLDIKVGDKTVHLIHVGPAHTQGDTLVHVPADKTVYTGDILFIGGHPIIWEGPVQNWINACDKIIAMDVETIVPGHGPITTKEGVEEVRHYLVTLRNEARRRYEAGMNYKEAAFDIALGVFDDWGDRERVVVNCATLFHEFGAADKPDIAALFGGMAEYATARPQTTPEA
jgi:glyoxylase-like metal-dependent hydrolase (beta-lactamase superfamily II)